MTDQELRALLFSSDPASRSAAAVLSDLAMPSHPNLGPPRRIQRQRTRGWRMPPGTIYVGRPTRWGNPFVPLAAYEDEYVRFPGLDAVECVRLFEERWRRNITLFVSCREMLVELRGHDLACWCRLGQPCHADVLLELANG